MKHEIRQRDAETEVGFITIDAASLVVQLNDAACSITGYQRQELLGDSVTKLIPMEYRERHYVAVTRRANGGESHIEGLPLRLPMLRKDGSQIEVEIVLNKTSSSPPEFTATFFVIEPPDKPWWRRFWEWGT